ncbi:hypothetical protein Bpfe_030790 [Biomphalaria pfeifferi]|uniref:Uncharacterized protein n=1 Tax=Biomphalaria pfeifferi TaxID=112525 RepID=A0AAD8ETI4_BIOPF|nr:hypothetical protein Bpfe_030790 [Biomphalaria pfeifferi]
MTPSRRSFTGVIPPCASHGAIDDIPAGLVFPREFVATGVSNLALLRKIWRPKETNAKKRLSNAKFTLRGFDASLRGHSWI